MEEKEFLKQLTSYGPMLQRFLRSRFYLSPDVIEDIYQDLCLSLWIRFKKNEIDLDRLANLVFFAGRNKAREHVRNDKNRRLKEDCPKTSNKIKSSSLPTPPQYLEYIEFEGLLMESLGGSPIYEETLESLARGEPILRYAQRASISPGTVQSRRGMTRSKILRHFGRKGININW